MTNLQKLFKLENYLAGYVVSEFKGIDRITLIAEEKRLLSLFNKVPVVFRKSMLKNMVKLDGKECFIELQRDKYVSIILCDVYMSNGINTYEVVHNLNGRLNNLEYQTKADINELLSSFPEYIEKV